MILCFLRTLKKIVQYLKRDMKLDKASNEVKSRRRSNSIQA